MAKSSRKLSGPNTRLYFVLYFVDDFAVNLASSEAGKLQN
jgi:hypothetical protein